MNPHIDLTNGSTDRLQHRRNRQHRQHRQIRWHRRPVALRLVAATAASAGATWALVRLGAALPGGLPAAATPAALGAWLTNTPVDQVAVRAMWAAATGTGGYLTAAHGLAAGAVTADSARALRLADRLSGGLVRRLSITGLAASIGAGAVGAPLGGAQSIPGDEHAPVMTLEGDEAVVVVEQAPVLVLESSGRGPARPPTQPAVPAPTMALERTAPTGPAATPGPPVVDPVDAVQQVTLIDALTVEAPPIAVGTAGEVELDAPIITTGLGVWIVRPGDSLWSIAEAVLQERAGTPADLEAVEAYWRLLVETNRPGLADPSNPDLLFTGQQLTLPLR
ncbi:MAG: LysM peptidoglycan-binding domain-containing protein [Acidimicrobiales bacterium]